MMTGENGQIHFLLFFLALFFDLIVSFTFD